VNLRDRERTLRPLFSLRKLEGFQAAQWWDPTELAELRRVNPALVVVSLVVWVLLRLRRNPLQLTEWRLALSEWRHAPDSLRHVGNRRSVIRNGAWYKRDIVA
jgi:hypothetical protein